MCIVLVVVLCDRFVILRRHSISGHITDNSRITADNSLNSRQHVQDTQN